MSRSVKADTNGNIVNVSNLPAEESGAGFINIDVPGVSDADLVRKCFVVGTEIRLRPEELGPYHIYVNESWVIDDEARLLAEIQTLESQVTPRRIREAILDGGGWLRGIEDQITAKRGELSGLRN